MINRDEWRTGDFEVAPNLTFNLVVPDVDWIKRALQGALLLLCDSENWEEVGTATIEQTVTAFLDIYNSLEVPD